MRRNNNDFHIFLLKPYISQRSRIVVIAHIDFRVIEAMYIHDTVFATRSLLKVTNQMGHIMGQANQMTDWQVGRSVDWHCSHKTKR
jgi:hypothetical protein